MSNSVFGDGDKLGGGVVELKRSLLLGVEWNGSLLGEREVMVCGSAAVGLTLTIRPAPQVTFYFGGACLMRIKVR